jgi:hypothetical protein
MVATITPSGSGAIRLPNQSLLGGEHITRGRFGCWSLAAIVAARSRLLAMSVTVSHNHRMEANETAPISLLIFSDFV